MIGFYTYECPFIGNALTSEGWRTVKRFRQVAGGMKHPTARMATQLFHAKLSMFMAWYATGLPQRGEFGVHPGSYG